MESRDLGEKRPDSVEDEPLREEDVTVGDRLDDRVQEADGLPDEPDED